MNNTTSSYRNLYLIFLYLTLFCCSHITTQSTLSLPPTDHFFKHLNSKPDIPITPKQLTPNQAFSLAICIDPSTVLSVEDNDIPLEDVFSKTSSFFRPVKISDLYHNKIEATDLIGNDKVYYRVYQASKIGDQGSESAFLYQKEKDVEDSRDHDGIKLLQAHLEMIPLDETAKLRERSEKEFDLICAHVENVDMLPSLYLESSLEILKGGNSMLLLISQSDPAGLLMDRESESELSQNIRKQEVPMKSNVLRANKGYKDDNIIVLDLEETEPVTNENTEFSSYSTSSKPSIGPDMSIRSAKTAFRSLRRLDETVKNETGSSESTLTTWIIVAVVVVVIFLIGITLAVIAFIKHRRNKNRQQGSNQAAYQQQRVRSETTGNTMHNNRAISAGEEATLATHSPPPVVRPRPEFMNSEDDIEEDPMQENFPCFNTPVRVDDVLRLFEIHFEGYKDNKGGDGQQCDICYDAKKTIMFSPCTHICACEPCAQEVMNVFGKCPLCRTQIEDLTYVVKGTS